VPSIAAATTVAGWVTGRVKQRRRVEHARDVGEDVVGPSGVYRPTSSEYRTCLPEIRDRRHPRPVTSMLTL
jgi:hypothetical protein